MADDVDEIDRSAKGDRLTTADASAPTPLSYAPPPLSGGTTGNAFLDAQKPPGSFDQLIRLANEDAGQDTLPTQEQTEKVLPDLPTTSGPVLQGLDAPSLSNDDVDKLTTRLSGEQKQDLTDLVAQSRPAQPDSRMPEIAQTPESMMRRAFGAFANPLTLIALTAGAFTKRPALNALAAAGGVIQGMNERRWQDVYLQQHKFRNSIAQVQQQMGLELADLGGILNNDKLTTAEKIDRATALADQYHDSSLKTAIQEDHLAGAQSFYDNRSQLVPALRNAQNHYDSLQQRQEAIKERQREFDLRLQEMQESREARKEEQGFRREERSEARDDRQAARLAAEDGRKEQRLETQRHNREMEAIGQAKAAKLSPADEREVRRIDSVQDDINQALSIMQRDPGVATWLGQKIRAGQNALSYWLKGAYNSDAENFASKISSINAQMPSVLETSKALKGPYADLVRSAGALQQFSTPEGVRRDLTDIYNKLDRMKSQITRTEGAPLPAVSPGPPTPSFGIPGTSLQTGAAPEPGNSPQSALPWPGSKAKALVNKWYYSGDGRRFLYGEDGRAHTEQEFQQQ